MRFSNPTPPFTLSASTLTTLLGTDGNVVGTQAADKVRFDLNWDFVVANPTAIADVDGAMLTRKSAVMVAILQRLAALENGTGTGTGGGTAPAPAPSPAPAPAPAPGASYTTLRDAAVAAAIANNASLWFLGHEADLPGNVFANPDGTNTLTGAGSIGYLKDRNANSKPAIQMQLSNRPTAVKMDNNYYAMNLPGSAFLSTQMVWSQQSNHTIIVKVRDVLGDEGDVRTAFSTGNSTNHQRYPQVRIYPLVGRPGRIGVTYVSDTISKDVGISNVNSSDRPPVFTEIKTGSTVNLYTNGVNGATDTVDPIGNDTFQYGYIGGLPMNGNEAMNGQIVLVCAGATAMNASDRAAIENFANLLGA